MNSTSISHCLTCNFKASCFDTLSNTQLEEISNSKIRINYKKGETIRKQGSFSKGILYLIEGITKVYREIDQIGQNSIVAFNTPGQLIGLTSLFTNKTAEFTVVAMTDCTLCCIDIENFQDLLKKNSDFAIDIVRSLNEQNNLLIDFQISNNHKQLHGRLAEAILYLSEHVFKSDSFSISLTRGELAEYTNMSTMSVVRILKSFKEDKILKDKSGFITILDRKKIEQISRKG